MERVHAVTTAATFSSRTAPPHMRAGYIEPRGLNFSRAHMAWVGAWSYKLQYCGGMESSTVGLAS
jgi:hypothetical protein